MCQINIDKYLLARYKQGGRTLPDVDCYGLVLEFFKNELKINLPLDNSDSVNTRTVRIKNGEIHKDLQFRNSSNFVYKVSFTLDVRE